MPIIPRQFSDPATTWRGAFLRAGAWLPVSICGSYTLSRLVPVSRRYEVLLSLLLGVAPVVMGLVSRSWRVAVAAATIGAVVLSVIYAVVWTLIRSVV